MMLMVNTTIECSDESCRYARKETLSWAKINVISGVWGSLFQWDYIHMGSTAGSSKAVHMPLLISYNELKPFLDTMSYLGKLLLFTTKVCEALQALASAKQIWHGIPCTKSYLKKQRLSSRMWNAVVWPISFESKCLTNAERMYRNIERNVLGILHSLEKVHYYNFSDEVSIITNHKPLVVIFKKDMTIMSQRLQ